MEKHHQNFQLPSPDIETFEDVNIYLNTLEYTLRNFLMKDFSVEGSLNVNKNVEILSGSLTIGEVSTTPDDPTENEIVIWLNTDGELNAKYNNGTNVYEGVLIY